ncbi:MAG: hypothetical protein DRP78_00565 [Candidatus Omnitrophota bacterium]|nr:MAG: hypothetical protein DRP78_00565 [Candidatus Omnitrophota bacterium]
MRKIFLLLDIFILCFFYVAGYSENNVFAQTSYEIEDDIEISSRDDEKLVSLDFKEAQLKDVLKVFSQQAGLNFVASQDVEDKAITLYMENVLVDDALNCLLKANNLKLLQQPKSNIIIVVPMQVEKIKTDTKIYRLRYLHGKGPSLGKEDSKNDKENSVREFLEPVLSEHGTMVEFSNVLLITDIPERFKLIDKIIDELDQPIPEVMLEVELIETTSDFLEDLGTKWNKEIAKYSGPARATPFPYTKWEDVDNRGCPEIFEIPGFDFSYGLISSAGLNWIVEMLKTDTNTKFLSKPRILVQDRELAEIAITADQVVSLESIMTTGGGVATIKTTVNRMEIGTTLKILPMINKEERYVSLMIEPSISRPVDSNFKSPDGIAYIDPHTRDLHTVVMVKDEDTVAIGGFITTDDLEVSTKVPFLGEIPFFGALFRHKHTKRVDKELLIFITPKIILPTDKVDIFINKKEQTSASLEQQGQSVKSVTAIKQATESFVGMNTKTVESTQFREQDDFILDMALESMEIQSIDLVK